MILKAKSTCGDDANPPSHRHLFKFLRFQMRADMPWSEAAYLWPDALYSLLPGLNADGSFHENVRWQAAAVNEAAVPAFLAQVLKVGAGFTASEAVEGHLSGLGTRAAPGD